MDIIAYIIGKVIKKESTTTLNAPVIITPTPVTRSLETRWLQRNKKLYPTNVTGVKNERSSLARHVQEITGGSTPPVVLNRRKWACN